MKILSKSVLLFVFLFAWAVPGRADDSAGVLAQILAGKGVINATELATVEAADPDRRVQVLAAILEKKGLLSGADLAKLSPSPQGSGSAVASQLKPAASPSGAQTARVKTSTESAPPVTSQNKFPITIYGTLLTNAFYDTSFDNIQDIPLFARRMARTRWETTRVLA